MSMIIVTRHQDAVAPADPTGDPCTYWHQHPRLLHNHSRSRAWITATSTRPRERVKRPEPGHSK